ncbi:MAG: hypothetical protein ACOYJG_07655 [Prevotella sp.]|jgi:hypothetical protein
MESQKTIYETTPDPEKPKKREYLKPVTEINIFASLLMQQQETTVDIGSKKISTRDTYSKESEFTFEEEVGDEEDSWFNY